MAHCAMVRVADDVYVNFYEVASIEASGEEEPGDTLIVLKCGHKVAINDTSPVDVFKKLSAGTSGFGGNKASYTPNCDTNE